MPKKVFGLCVVIAITGLLAVGCSGKQPNPIGGEQPQTQAQAKSQVSSQPAIPAIPTDPVTITLQMPNALNVVFQNYLEPVLKQKMPFITLEYFKANPKLEDNIATGNIPDIVMTNGGMRPVMDLKLPYDLNGLIKKYNFDLNKIDKNMVTAAKAFSNNGELFGLPTNRNARVLLYNKDIFDKFAVPYPHDGMTWDDTIALAKKLTRSEGGVDYHGLNPYKFELLKSQTELHYFDKDGKAQLSTPGWQKIAATWKAIYDIPNNYLGGDAGSRFSKDKNTAMLLNNSGWLLRSPPPDLNWDYVTAPVFENGLIPDTVMNMISISAPSKNKDIAFQVVALLFSDEVQAAFGRDAALVPSSSNPDVLKQYAADVKGKNVMADVNGRTAVKVVEQYDNLAEPIVNDAFLNIALGKQDMNTALREAEEKVNQKIAEVKAK